MTELINLIMFGPNNIIEILKVKPMWLPFEVLRATKWGKSGMSLKAFYFINWTNK